MPRGRNVVSRFSEKPPPTPFHFKSWHVHCVSPDQPCCAVVVSGGVYLVCPVVVEGRVKFRFHFLLSLPLLGLMAGCGEREAVPVFSSSEAVQALPEENRKPLEAIMIDVAGTFDSPKLVGNESFDPKRLKLGQQVYQRNCVQCHGVTGDGQGTQAASMYPKPRDYRQGIFKFSSTTYGSKPLHSDLVSTVTEGVRGTSMPSFALLPSEEIGAVVDYVILLARRGEVEFKLVRIAEADIELEPEFVQDAILAPVAESWDEAWRDEIIVLSPQPNFTIDHVLAGQEAFLSQTGGAGCIGCHGPDGRGLTGENLSGHRKDGWNNITRAADLTSGMLHGGAEPIDIYRRIYGGINGTPMPSFASSLSDDPDKVWNLVAYVMYLADRRRDGEAGPPGPMAKYGEEFDFAAWESELKGPPAKEPAAKNPKPKAAEPVASESE